MFKVKLVLPSDYPSAPPKGAPRRRAAHSRPLPLFLKSDLTPPPLRRAAGYFLTRIYHPNISKTGEICVNTLKKDWQSNLGIGHVLQVPAAPCTPTDRMQHADRPHAQLACSSPGRAWPRASRQRARRARRAGPPP